MLNTANTQNASIKIRLISRKSLPEPGLNWRTATWGLNRVISARMCQPKTWSGKTQSLRTVRNMMSQSLRQKLPPVGSVSVIWWRPPGTVPAPSVVPINAVEQMVPEFVWRHKKTGKVMSLRDCLRFLLFWKILLPNVMSVLLMSLFWPVTSVLSSLRKRLASISRFLSCQGAVMPLRNKRMWNHSEY